MVTTKDMVQVYVYLRYNVLATTDDFMSVDRKAFKTAVWGFGRNNFLAA